MANRAPKVQSKIAMDIIAFVPTRNPRKAREFFETTLGLRFVSDDQFALVFDANGVMMRVVDVSGVADYKPAPFTILGWSVSNVGKTVKDALIAYSKTDDGKTRFSALFQWDGMQEVDANLIDWDYGPAPLPEPAAAAETPEAAEEVH